VAVGLQPGWVKIQGMEENSGNFLHIYKCWEMQRIKDANVKNSKFKQCKEQSKFFSFHFPHLPFSIHRNFHSLHFQRLSLA